MSVTNVRACEPGPRAVSREAIFPSHCFFSYLVIYLFIFWRFQFNVNVFLSKWYTSFFDFLSCVKFRARSFRRLLKVRYE